MKGTTLGSLNLLYLVVVDGPVTALRQDTPVATRASSQLHLPFTFPSPSLQASSSPARMQVAEILSDITSLRVCVSAPVRFNLGVCNILIISRPTAKLLLW